MPMVGETRASTEPERRQGHLLGIDAGGTVVKAAIFTSDGRLVAAARELVPVFSPDRYRRERDPAVLWGAVTRTVRAALKAANQEGDGIAAVAVTGYGNGLYLVDEDGEPVMNGVLSSDCRAESMVEAWRADGVEREHRTRSFQGLWAGKPLPLVAWLARNEPGILARAHKLLLCKDFVRLKLTGRVTTDVTDAAASSLLSGTERTNFEPMFDLLGIGDWKSLMPAIAEPSAWSGTVTQAAAAELGLRAGTPVTTGLADNAAMIYGSGAFRRGEINIVSGTWGLHHAHVACPDMRGVVLACCQGAEPGNWLAIEGSASSASSFEWFLNAYGPLLPKAETRSEIYRQIDRMVERLNEAELAQDSESVAPLVFLPYLNGAFDAPLARAAFVGLAASHSLAHIARALFEGVAFEHRRHVERLFELAPAPKRISFTGGATNSEVWSQTFANVLDLPIEIPEGEEVGALGAVMTAAVALGWHGDLESAATAMTRVCRRITPEPLQVSRLRHRYDAYCATRECLGALWDSDAFNPAISGGD